MADINRGDAAGLLATQDIWEIIQDATHSSVALQTFRRINMGTKNARMPVLTALPAAGFVDESSSKDTSEMTWGDKQLAAEEIAVIVPIHENVLEDSEMGIWEEVRPRVAEAFGRVLDGAVLFGTNKPATWPAALVPGSVSGGNLKTYDSTTEDLTLAINDTWALVEDDGHDVNVQYARRDLRAKLRGLRDADGQPLYISNIRGDGRVSTVYGEDIVWVTNGSWVKPTDTSATPDGVSDKGATMLVGDRSKAILGIRSDMQVKLLTEATVGSNSGTPLNLAERDMVALRFKMRVGFQVADPVMIEASDFNADPSTNVYRRPYPFAVLRDDVAV